MPTITLTSKNDTWSTFSAGAYTVFGGDGNDTLQILTSKFATGDAGDTLDGGAGDDFLSGGYKNDILIGGAGADRLFGGEGDDNLDGGADNDYMDGGVGNDVLNGGAGDDTLNGGFGNDTLNGGDGNDTIITSLGNDTVDGGAGNDQILAASGNDTLRGGAGSDSIDAAGGNDTVYGDAGDDTLQGSNGNDFLDGGAGNDIIDGGSDVDTVSYATATAGVTVDLSITTAQDTIGYGIDTITGVENLDGSNFNDRLTGNTGNNLIKGLDGDDLLFGGDGDDGLVGGNGNDILDGGNGADQMDGGSGFDIADYSASPAAVTINLTDALTETGGFAQGDTIMFQSNGTLVRTIEKIIGSAFDDSLTADNLTIQLDGGAGNDTLIGGAGNDTLIGGPGNDTMAGGLGNDIYLVDSAGDVVTEAAGGGTDTVFTSVNYALSPGSAVESLRANAGSTGLTLTGNELANIIFGNTGGDRITGGGGSDLLLARATLDPVNIGNNQDLSTDVFDYNSLSELQPKTTGSLDTIIGFSGGGSVQGPDVIDIHDLLVSVGIDTSVGASTLRSQGYWDLAFINLPINVGGTIFTKTSLAVYIDIDGGSNPSDGGEYWVAGLWGTTTFNLGANIIV
ncbi:MAG: calcium-binding protein [Gammaproteobacteria bacterium]